MPRAQGKLAVLDEYNKQQRRHERGSPYYAMKWGIGETPGIYDAGNGYWNQTCSMGPQGRVCTPREHVLYAHPFNDSSLPLSFWKLDPALRNCLQYGENPPCRYNHRLLPNPSKVGPPLPMCTCPCCASRQGLWHAFWLRGSEHFSPGRGRLGVQNGHSSV